MDHAYVRMDVEQDVVLPRDNQRLQLVTWYYEKSEYVRSFSSALGPMVEDGVDTFLDHWLTANGR